MATNILTQERVHELLTYDPNTGLFRWRKTRRNAKINVVAGTIDPRGYVRISIDCKIYAAHRLAWLYMYGSWPTNEIDHINRIRGDNRIANLRDAPRVVNTQNVGFRKDNKSGVKGVVWHKAQRKWRARIQANGVMHELGYFLTIAEAKAAYDSAEAVLHIPKLAPEEPSLAAANLQRI